MSADTITLSHLRAALERALTHPENAALARLPADQRTAEGLAAAYLPRVIWTWVAAIQHEFEGAIWSDQLMSARPRPLDLTDPGTCHAVLVALALALGLDPGPAGLDGTWRPLLATTRAARRRVGWWLSCDNEETYFLAAADALGDDDEIVNGTIASEPDSIKALSLALLHAVEAPMSVDQKTPDHPERY